MERIFINPIFEANSVICEIWKGDFVVRFRTENIEDIVKEIYKVVMMPIIKADIKVKYEQLYNVVVDSSGFGMGIVYGLESKGVKVNKIIPATIREAFSIS